MFQLLYFFGWNWTQNHNNGMDGNNNACDTMSHSATLGQDDVCLGGWHQHHIYGFAQGDQAYTSSSTYDEAVQHFTGIIGANDDGGFRY
ncbi:hypothetical protein GUITHDRAFT_154220, partial [Guillardia theta CCMP2712]|mmetsp:Transcript_35871/g.112203  ORF Transcript_35871/g.112203 Transcript_35871/m.112203 type:complete len:89 (-) Transcript_35871:143-409(-)